MTARADEAAAGEQKLIDLVEGASVLLVGFSNDRLGTNLGDLVKQAGRPFGPIEQMSTLAEVKAYRAQLSISVLVFGPGVELPPVLEFLDELRLDLRIQQPTTIFIGDHDPLDLLPLVYDDRLFYFCPPQLSDAEIVNLVFSGFMHYRNLFILEIAELERSKDARAVTQRKLLTAGEVLLQVSDLEGLEEPILEALDDLVGIDSGRLWLYDSIGHTLSGTSSAGLEVSAVTGLTSFVARTGTPVRLDQLTEDARYDFEADGEKGRLLAVPILGPDRRVLGVLAAYRRSSEPVFTQEDESRTLRLAEHSAPFLALRAPQPLEVLRGYKGAQGSGPDIFRSEAIEANASGFSERGRILQNTPVGLRWTWGILLSGFVVALIFGWVASVHEYATGPAVIRWVPIVEGAVQSDETGAESVVALIPGHLGPQVTVGLPLRLTLAGYSGLSIELEVTSVGEQVIGRQKALDTLDDLALETELPAGSVVWVEARLTQATFKNGAQALAFRHGMQGEVDIRLRSRPILFHLIPGLESAFQR